MTLKRVFMTDLLALTPFYDRYLFEGVSPLVKDLVLYSVSYPYESDYFKTTDVILAKKIADFVSLLNIKNKSVRRSLQLVEYAYNWHRLIKDTYLQKPQIVHIQWLPLNHIVSFELNCLKKLQNMGSKIVYTAHNSLPHDSKDRYVSQFKRVYKTVDKIIVHSQKEKYRILNTFKISENKIHIVPHGPMFHDLPQISKSDARKKLNYKDEKVVLFMGTLKPYKGIEELLYCISKVAQKHKTVKFILAGQGEHQYVKKIVALVNELRLADLVDLKLQFIKVNKLSVLHSAADVVVMPYWNASQSGVLFTAASFNAPIVATKVGGIPEVISTNEYGILVKPKNVDDLANGLIKMLNFSQQKRDEIAANLKTKVNTNLNWSKIGHQTVNVYEQALSS